MAVALLGGLPQSAGAAPVSNGSVVSATVTPLLVADETDWAMASTESGPVAEDQRTRFAQDIAAAEGAGVRSVGLSSVLGDLNVTARPLCHQTNAAGAEGFCWNDAYGDDSKLFYTPQGITGSGESRDNERLVGGRRILVTSWHSDEDHSSGADQLMRVTFADVTVPTNVTYRHVLLVTPTASGFAALPGHADSVTWYQNYLYVSNAGGLAVFDLTKFWVTDESGGGVGASNGKYHAAWHKYALPQIDRYHYIPPTPKNFCGHFNGYPPCFAGASLDDSGPVPVLVTTEVNGVKKSQQQTFADSQVVVRWPLDRTTGLPSLNEKHELRPEAAFTSTVSGAQGIAMNRGRFVVSAPCPEFVEGGENIPSCLYHAWPGEPVRLWTRTGINNQNVSYWPATDDLWTVNEYPTGRVVFHIPWPRPDVPLRSLTGTWGDLSGDQLPDLLGIRPHASPLGGTGNGDLVLYPGAPDGVGTRTSIGTGWNSIRLMAGVGDLNADGRPDVLAVEDVTGDLWLYPGAPGGLGARVKLSTGWNVVQTMTGVGDLNADGLPDLMAIWTDGTARLYPGRSGGLGASTPIGTGWNSMRLVTGVGDLNADGRPDVLAVENVTGDLWLYPGATGGLGARVKLSTGWNVVQTMAGVGDLTADGLPDLVAIWTDGTARLYPGRPGGLGAGTPVDLGWSGGL
ncbi:FG-GAP repeat domain-containing protein [Streptomyces sp. NPDC059875]|uniref:FG-GAP repeat domain-containing protein n=1 Tax=unclassified Streptomyces TaxID=2593676 RepID=UPI003668826F